MELAVTRGPNHDDSCIGDFFIDDAWWCYSLEDLVREVDGQPVVSWKVQDQTAIPRGRYQVIIDYSAHFAKNMLHILNVPGFEGVRIHGGNDAADTDGCILVGTRRSDDDISNCAPALAKIYGEVQDALATGDTVWITIK